MKYLHRKTPEQKALQAKQKFEDYAANQYKGERTPFFARMLHPKMHYAAKMQDACEAQAKAIMEHADDLIFHISTEGTVLSLSDSYLRTLGYGKEELVGGDAFRILHPDDVEAAKKAFATACETGQGVKAELRIIAKDGSVIAVESKGSVIKDARGKIIGGMVINRDITEQVEIRKKLDDAVKQLTDVVKSKGKLFSIVAHDLRSPFQTFLGGTQMLNIGLDDYSREDIRSIAGQLHGEAVKVFRLLENLLTWAHIQGGGMKSVPERIRLKTCVEEAIEPLEAPAGQKGVRITHSVGGEAVFADPRMLGRILQNLVSNSIKFTKSGGEISISAYETADGKTVIIVRDSGVGMGPETLERLFTLEMKSGRGTEGESGTGIGLPLVNDLVRLNNGTIEVKSEIGKGTVFTITLPASAPEGNSG